MESTDALHTQSTRTRLVATAAVVLLFAVPAICVIIAGVQHSAAFSDQQVYHLPTIRQFEREWPRFNFQTYSGAMTPGYHLLMAAVAKAGGCVTALQLATLAITAGFLATLAWAVSRSQSITPTLLLCLPLAWSQYIFAGGVYVVPHNPAWWGVLGILLLSLSGDGKGEVKPWPKSILSGLLLWALILVRQIHVWAMAPLLAAAWLNGTTPGKRIARVLIVLLCCVPAILTLAWFYASWGGLAPKTQDFAKPVGGINVAAVVMILATFGFLGPWFIGRLPANRTQWLFAVVGLVIGLVVALIEPTTRDQAAGRWSGLWNLLGTSGIFHDRSIPITFLASLGGAVVGLLLATEARRRRCIWVTSLTGFIAANAVVNQAWQRYYEPMVLMTCVLIAARQPMTAGRRIGLMLLILLQAALTYRSLTN